MDLHLSLDAREVLFHLNYMGYHSISREQLKSFMTDLKKLIKYESNPQQSTTNENQTHVPVSHTHNFERLFELHTQTSKLKQREKHPVRAASSKDMNKENDKDNNKKLTRNKSSGEIILRTKENATNQKRTEAQCQHDNINTKKRNPPPSHKVPPHSHKAASENSNNKENVPKMWIRPKSAQPSRLSIKKRNDPVALYEEYQKDWERFKANICESSRSELRWKIREKMLSNH